MPRLFKSPRFWIGLSVTIFWLAMMALMAIRSGLRPGGGLRRMGVSPEVLMVSWTDYDHWVWVRSRDKTLGLSHMAVHPSTGFGAGLGDDAAASYEMESRTRLRFELLGHVLPMDISMAGRMNTAFELKTLQVLMRIADQQVLCQAFCEDDMLYYRISVQSADSPLILPSANGEEASVNAGSNSMPLAGLLPSRDVCGRAPLTEPILMSNILMPVITRAKKIEKGAKWTTKASDPVSGMLDLDVEITVQDQEEIKVDDLTYTAWRMTEKAGAMQSTVWYDPDGRLLRQEMSNGLSLIRANASEALSYDPEFRRRPVYPVLDREWIRANLDPALIDQPLDSLLPGLPVM